MRGYTTREVAEVLGLPTSKILGWTRSGLLTPERGERGTYLYSFQDIVLLRAARGLLEANVPTRRVKAALEALRAQLPVGRPLSAVHISAFGDRILVRDDDTVWDPGSGQVQMDFAVVELAEAAAPVARRALAEARRDSEDGGGGAPDQGTDASSGGTAGPSADDWYNTALDLEAVAVDEAMRAYRRALDLEPEHADAHLNLGRLLHEEGTLPEAERHYRAAAAADPEGARPRYNLGVVLEDQGRDVEAIAAYEEALALDNRLATAHFNLARLYESRGNESGALNHLAAYKRLIAQA